MASTAVKRPAVKPRRQRRVQRKKPLPPARAPQAAILVDNVTAILLISPDAKSLSEFYRAVLGLPLEQELHDGMPLHYGYSLGDVHFAIHPADGGWPGVPTRNAQSPVITFSTSNLKTVASRVAANGIEMTGPSDHGFGHVLSFRDPDGNFISIVEYRSEHW